MMKKIFLILSLFALAACSSALKQECEKKDWFAHGYELALQGKRVTGDAMFNACRKEEAEFSESQLDLGFKAGRQIYCEPDQALITGKKGWVFNTDMCDENYLHALLQRHAEGVRVYCEPPSGYRSGLAGESYSKICPADQEKSFLPQYLAGRKSYLEKEVARTGNELAQEKVQYENLSQQARTISVNLASLPSPTTVVRKVWNDAAKAYEDRAETQDPFASERSRLRELSSDTTRQLIASNANIQKLNKYLLDSQNELKGLAQ